MARPETRRATKTGETWAPMLRDVLGSKRVLIPKLSLTGPEIHPGLVTEHPMGGGWRQAGACQDAAGQHCQHGLWLLLGTRLGPKEKLEAEKGKLWQNPTSSPAQVPCPGTQISHQW